MGEGAPDRIPYLLPDQRSLLEHGSAFLTESLAFYLYVAYAERLTSEARRSPQPIPLPRVLRNLLLDPAGGVLRDRARVRPADTEFG
jgi:hypothetical protein